MGLLYIENTLASHVFTPDRIALLEVLAAQAAISLEVASLYEELQEENIERKRAEEALRPYHRLDRSPRRDSRFRQWTLEGLLGIGST